jgi:bacillithiol system protein YtxJ
MSQQSSASASTFVEITDRESLDRFLAQSNGSPAVIFKHSNLCGVSARAYAEMSRVELPVGLVIVQQSRSVSDEIEARTGVGHETPQVFIIRDGKALWTASHGQVKAAAVEAALLEIGGQNQSGLV